MGKKNWRCAGADVCAWGYARLFRASLGIGMCLLCLSLGFLGGESAVYAEPYAFQSGDELYASALSLPSAEQQSAAFNQALALYLRQVKAQDRSAQAGELAYRIGNTYFQLGAYPWAIWHYYRALSSLPRDSKVKENLALAQKHLQGQPSERAHAWPSMADLQLDHWLTLSERSYLGCLAALATGGLAGAFLVCRRYGWKRALPCFKALALSGGVLGTVLVIWLGSSLLYSCCFAPIEGVLVYPALMYRDTSPERQVVVNRPLLAGLKVEVVGVEQSGQWIKIVTAEGQLGYISHRAIRLL